MLELSGPQVRTAPLSEPIEFDEGSTVRFVESTDATPQEVSLSTTIIVVEPGDHVLLDDGPIKTTVKVVEGETVRT
jgi:pyruvate kinase